MSASWQSLQAGEVPARRLAASPDALERESRGVTTAPPEPDLRAPGPRREEREDRSEAGVDGRRVERLHGQAARSSCR